MTTTNQPATETRLAKAPCRICGTLEIIGKSTCAHCGATGKQRTR